MADVRRIEQLSDGRLDVTVGSALDLSVRRGDYWAVLYVSIDGGPANGLPRDEKGRPGPYEASLVGNPIADPENPLEVLRTIHSFDPCIACAVHTLDVEGNEIARVKVL